MYFGFDAMPWFQLFNSFKDKTNKIGFFSFNIDIWRPYETRL